MECKCVVPRTLKELFKWILFQHCCAMLRRSRNKRNVGGCGLKKFDRFRTLHNNSQQHPTTCNMVCKRTQHVTSNNVGSCWPAMLRPFSRGLKNIVTHILPFLLQFFLVIRWYRSFYSSFSLFRFGYLETINIKDLKGEYAFYNWNVDATVVELSLKLLFNNCSLRANGLWVNSPWGRRANGLLTQRLWRREE